MLLQDPGRNFATVIERLHLQKIDHASRRPGSNIGAAENDPTDPRVHKRPCAHRAGFLCYVKIAVNQTPIADGRFCLCEGQHFRVRGGVL